MNKNIKILLVEDDRDDAELLKNALDENSVKYDLHLISQGDKAVSWLIDCDALPDIVVMDLNLPKLHGREILQKLKNEGRFNNLPIVVLSTSSSAEDISFCMENGAKSFIIKPTTLEGFNNAVDTIIRNVRTKI